MVPICHGFKSSIRRAYKDTIDDSKQSPVSKFVKWSHNRRNTNYSTIRQPIKNRSANEADWRDGSKCGGVRTFASGDGGGGSGKNSGTSLVGLYAEYHEALESRAPWH
eukprot:scaffold37341_cov51-Attheya_sp.AAC.9